MNYVVLAMFIAASAYGFGIYRKTLTPLSYGSDADFEPQNQLLFVVVTLVVCLCYFFGFFGLSYVTDSLPTSPSGVNLKNLVEEEKLQAGSSTEVSAMKKNYRGGNEVILPESAGATTIIPTLAKATVATSTTNLNVPPICSDTNNPSVPPAKVETKTSAYDFIAEFDYGNATDDAILELLVSGALKDYQLEKKLGDYTRAVKLRRLLYEQLLNMKLELIPYENFDYGKIFGANCEIVLGYVPIPLGIVGPLTLNEQPVYIPMATTEGCLVASANRGCKAISASGGCSSVLLKDAITRAPCLRFSTAVRAAECKKWIADPDNYEKIEAAFNSTTSFGKLVSISTTLAGRNAYLRFCCMSGTLLCFFRFVRSLGCVEIALF